MRIIFKNRYGEIRCVWAIIPLILLIMIGLLTSQALLPEDSYHPVNQIVVTILYGLFTIGGGVLLFKLFYKRGFNRMGLTKDRCLRELTYGILIGVAATTLMFIIFILVGEVKIINYNLKLLFSVTMIVEIMSLGVFVFVEEFLTRGYFMTALKTTRNKTIIFFTSAILFSLLHILNSGVTLLSALNTIFAGLLFAYMFVKTGKLWLSIGFHFAWNFMLGTILGVNVSGNEQASVVVSEVGNNSLLVGGSYGPEGGFVVTLILLLCFLFVRFVIKTPNQNIWTMENDLPFFEEKHL